MSKDPAFLFYSSDFLTGVMDLTMEERGQYITLLCLQHQKGHLNEKTICLSVGNVSVDVMKKFKQDSDGLFYNERTEEEIQKRSKYAESRRKNGSLGGRPKKPYAKPYDKPSENHTENENINEDINEDIFIDEKTRIDEMMPEFKDMTFDECEKAHQWLNNKMYCQTISKDKFVEIVRKFKGSNNGNQR